MESDLKFLTEICQDLRIEKVHSLSKYAREKLIEALPKNPTLTSLYVAFDAQIKIKLTHLSCASVSVAKKGEKTIIIIGEYHLPYKNVGSCPKGTLRPTDFLPKLFQYAHIPIDFFLETSNYPSGGENDIGELRRIVRNCVSGRTCNYRSIRAHYTDLRFHTKETQRFPSVGDVTYINDRSKAEEFLPTLKKEYIYLIRKDYLKKIRKQIANIQDPMTKKSIEVLYREYIESEEEFMINEFRNFYEDMRTRLKLPPIRGPESTIRYMGLILAQIEKDHIDYLRDFIYLTSVYWMNVGGHVGDLYAFARMFRTFRKEDGKKMFPFSIEPRNIIFYGGDYHATRMRKFARDLGFDVQVLEKEPTKGRYEDYPFCVKIPTGTFFGINKV